MIRLSINGKTHQIDADPNTPLLWVIREQVGLTGTKYGCGIAQCGACTVHLDGVAMRSCSVPLSAVTGKQITTIEGLAQNGVLHKVQKAWLDHDVPQCGYCQSGMIMAVAALLAQSPKPTDPEIDAPFAPLAARAGSVSGVYRPVLDGQPAPHPAAADPHVRPPPGHRQRAGELAIESEPTRELLTFYHALLQSQKEVYDFLRSRREGLPTGSLAQA